MQTPPIPDDEALRLTALRGLSILDTPPEERFDRLTRLARSVFDVEIALVSLVDEQRQWFKSRQGLEACDSGRDVSFCGHAILGGAILQVPDAALDTRFADNPFVIGPPYIRFYAGAPLSTADGYRIGTLCIIDSKPRTLSDAQCRILRDLADCVDDEINQVRLHSERKASEIALRTQSEHTQSILDNMIDGVITINQFGVMESVNPAAARMFGFDRGEMLGRNVSMLMPAPHRENHDSYIHNYQITGIARIVGIGREVEGCRKDGTVFPMDLAICEVGRPGQPRYMGVVRDITEQRRAESELREARDAALALARMKSEFMATMSHEIRTPMNGVLGMAQVLGKTPLDANQRKYVDTILRSGKALLTVLSDILDFSKIEAGRLELERTAFSLRQTVSDVVELYSEQAAAKRLDLVLHCAADCPRQVVGDPGRVRQVVLNLVGNAIKFTDAGSVRVEIAVIARHPDRATLRVAVTDTGIGIPRAGQTRLFDSFSQVDASTTRKYGGSGLGLAICKRLVELMGGEIGLISAAGEGSTFWFSVPFALAQDVAPESLDIGADDALPLAISGRVLLVEDVDFNQIVVKTLLEPLGLDVDVANNGEEALRRLDEDRYDLILMDCQMPVMDGYEATRKIRARERPGVHIPIIALTASVFKVERQKCADAGMDDFIPKPVDEAVLRDRVVKWLRDARPAPVLRTEGVSRPRMPGDPELCSAMRYAKFEKLMGAQAPAVVASFIANGEEKIRVLEQAARSGDAATLQTVSHALKGISATVGATRMHRLAGELEQRVAKGEVSGALERVLQLGDAFQRTKEWLRSTSRSEPAVREPQ